MLVVETLSLEIFNVLRLVDVLEGVQEQTVVLLKNRVFGRKHQREVAVESILEAGVGEFLHGALLVEHAKVHATFFEISDDFLDRGC